MIYDKIVSIDDLILGDHDVLASIERDSKVDIIMSTDDSGGMAENTNEYAVIRARGKDVLDDRYNLGNVILAVNDSRGNKSFEYHKKKYVIFSSHSIGLVTTPDNFLPTKRKLK